MQRGAFICASHTTEPGPEEIGFRCAQVHVAQKGHTVRKEAYVGGNWSNGGNVGPFYVNLNNTVSNSNTNIGASLSFYPRDQRVSYNAAYVPQPLLKINSYKTLLVAFGRTWCRG